MSYMIPCAGGCGAAIHAYAPRDSFVCVRCAHPAPEPTAPGADARGAGTDVAGEMIARVRAEMASQPFTNTDIADMTAWALAQTSARVNALGKVIVQLLDAPRAPGPDAPRSVEELATRLEGMGIPPHLWPAFPHEHIATDPDAQSTPNHSESALNGAQSERAVGDEA